MRKKDSKNSKFGLGLMVTGVLAAAGATALALFKKKKREEVYHEAELKAMNELDDLMAESEAEDCENCSCAEECTAADEPAEEQPLPADPMQEDDDEEASEEPIEDVAADDAAEEQPEA